MSSIPSNLARVPNSLVSQVMMGSLNRTTSSLLQAQIQLSTGRAVNRPSDNSVAASTITTLDDLIERRDQRLLNLSHGEALLNNVDAGLGSVNDDLIEARGIALSQIGFGSDAQTRSNQAKVIDAMLENLRSIANQQYQGIYYFGGKQTAKPPIEELLGGLRYTGQGSGMITDSGLSKPIEITMSAEQAFGALSSRVQGDRDLDPASTPDTRLSDLNGARGFGVSLGTLEVNVGGTQIEVDLTGSNTVQDVVDTLQTRLQSIDPGAAVSIAGSGRQLQITGNTTTVTIADPLGANVGADLGITGTYPPGGAAGRNLDARLTDLTPLSSLSGVTLPLGSIRITNAGQSREVDLSGAQTVQDVRNAIEETGIGVRVEIAESGDRLNVVNELSGGSMSVGEVLGGTTAMQLGIRSLTGSTRLADFNDGLGVDIVSGRVDPISGLPDPARNVDFTVTLKDGTNLDIDLAGAETVQDVIDIMNAAGASAGVGGGSSSDPYFVWLAFDGNGIEVLDRTAATGTTTFAGVNNSHAAADLGFPGSSTSANVTGEDRATVAVDSVFSHLIALREALEANDETGIEVAASKLEGDIQRVAQARADVGVRTRRIADTTSREEDLRIQDISLKSQVQDLDYTEAAIRFSTLQQQLQAGLVSTSQATSLTLLDFLR